MQPTVLWCGLVPQFNVTSHNPEASHRPRSWINTHYPILNTGLDRNLGKLYTSHTKEGCVKLQRTSHSIYHPHHRSQNTGDKWKADDVLGEIFSNLYCAQYSPNFPILTPCSILSPLPITFGLNSLVNSPTWACLPSDSIRTGLCTPSQPHRLNFRRTTLDYRLFTVQFSQVPPTSMSYDPLQNDYHSPMAFPAFDFGFGLQYDEDAADHILIALSWCYLTL